MAGSYYFISEGLEHLDRLENSLKDRFGDNRIKTVVGSINSEFIDRLEKELADSPAAKAGLELKVDSVIYYCLKEEEQKIKDRAEEDFQKGDTDLPGVTVVLSEELIQDMLDNLDNPETPETVTDLQKDFIEDEYAKMRGHLAFHYNG